MKNDNFRKDRFCDFRKIVQGTSGSKTFGLLKDLNQWLQAQTIKILSVENRLSSLVTKAKLCCKRSVPESGTLFCGRWFPSLTGGTDWCHAVVRRTAKLKPKSRNRTWRNYFQEYMQPKNGLDTHAFRTPSKKKIPSLSFRTGQAHQYCNCRVLRGVLRRNLSTEKPFGKVTTHLPFSMTYVFEVGCSQNKE